MQADSKAEASRRCPKPILEVISVYDQFQINDIVERRRQGSLEKKQYVIEEIYFRMEKTDKQEAFQEINSR